MKLKKEKGGKAKFLASPFLDLSVENSQKLLKTHCVFHVCKAPQFPTKRVLAVIEVFERTHCIRNCSFQKQISKQKLTTQCFVSSAIEFLFRTAPEKKFIIISQVKHRASCTNNDLSPIYRLGKCLPQKVCKGYLKAAMRPLEIYAFTVVFCCLESYTLIHFICKEKLKLSR